MDRMQDSHWHHHGMKPLRNEDCVQCTRNHIIEPFGTNIADWRHVVNDTRWQIARGISLQNEREKKASCWFAAKPCFLAFPTLRLEKQHPARALDPSPRDQNGQRVVLRELRQPRDVKQILFEVKRGLCGVQAGIFSQPANASRQIVISASQMTSKDQTAMSLEYSMDIP